MFPSFRSFAIFLGCLIVIVLLAVVVILNIKDIGYAVMCVESRAVEIPSPDGRYVVRSVWSRCFLEGGDSLVYLRTAGWGIPRLKLNRVFAYEGDLDHLRLRWEVPHTLVIEHNACAAIIWFQRTTWRDVSITYHQQEGLPPEYHCREQEE